MEGRSTIKWDRFTCRRIINSLRDGVPPPAEAIQYLSVGAEPHLDRARRGMQCAAQGAFDSSILVGRYGIGKTHLLRHVEVLAKAEGFMTRYVEIGSGGVYFNSPEEIARQIADITFRETLPKGRGYYTDRKFIDQLNYIAGTVAQQNYGKRGLIILLDEMENSFDWSNLPRLRSRIKAYHYLNTLFTGQSSKAQHRRHLENIFIMLGITPNVLDQAMAEESGYYHGGDWVANPATEWAMGVLPDQLLVEPLSSTQALDLLRRIRTIHSRAFEWNADVLVGDSELLQIVTTWVSHGTMRDERQLVKAAVELLELAEQQRAY